MKVCTKCRKEQPDSEFHLKNKNTGKLHSWCKMCQRQARHGSYIKNKAYYLGKSRQERIVYNEKVLSILTELKSSHCTDCGNSYPPYVMDFDHARGQKRFTIGDIWHHRYGPDVLKTELQKCDLVCSNCHRVRTWKRRNGIRDRTCTG